MFQRTFRGLALLCSLVILASGSPRIHLSDQQDRNRRHASCPSCSRDCPDALANWYATPSKKDYYGLGQQFAPSANIQPSLSFYPAASPYDGAFGSRRAQFEVPRDSSKRENPFASQRRFDSDVAPTPSTSFYGTRSSMTSYQSPVDRTVGRMPIQRPSFYDRPESDLQPIKLYSSYQPLENVATLEGIRSPYEDSRKLKVVYRADKYPDDSADPNVGVFSEYPRGSAYGSRSAMGMQERETTGRGYQQTMTDQFRDSPVGYPQMTAANGNAYPGPRGQGSEGDALKSVNYNTRYQMQPVVTDQMAGVSVYQGQRGQQLEGDSSKSVNYNPRYQVQPVGADEVRTANGCRNQRGQQFEEDSLKSVNYNPHYQPRAIKLMEDDDQGDDKLDSRHDLREEMKGMKEPVGEQDILKKTEKPTEAIFVEKITEAPQGSRVKPLKEVKLSEI